MSFYDFPALKKKKRPSKHTEALIVTGNQVYLQECTNERNVKCAFWNSVLYTYTVSVFVQHLT